MARQSVIASEKSSCVAPETETQVRDSTLEKDGSPETSPRCVQHPLDSCKIGAENVAIGSVDYFTSEALHAQNVSHSANSP
jgi:hypothetical protein